MTTTRRSRREEQRTKRNTRRVWVWILASVALLVVTLGVLVTLLVPKVSAVRDAMAQAIPVASSLQSHLMAGSSEEGASDALELQRLTSEARAQTTSRLWSFGEWVPFVRNNLIAVRVAVEETDSLAKFLSDTAPRLDVGSLSPTDGAIDVAKIRELSVVVTEAGTLLSSSLERIDGVDQTFVLPQAGDALAQLREKLSGANEVVSGVEPLVRAMPALLGGDGERLYLLMVQGNSEVRASGGNPAALALLRADAGRIEIVEQTDSHQFENARPSSVIPLDAETEAIYGDIIGRWIPNMTATPDFPTTAEIMRGWWQETEMPAFDSIISVDPVALSYVLAITGPVTLPTGEVIDSQNAVEMLLNTVYFDYPFEPDAQGVTQDEFFALAAGAIFSKMMQGTGDITGLFGALAKGAEQDRIKIWSEQEDLSALISGTRLAGVLPKTNEDATVTGVYFNDTTASKMDYYVDASITASTSACFGQVGQTQSVSVTLTNSLDPSIAEGLPYYIVGPYYSSGTVATDVLLYSPVGASITGWTTTGGSQEQLVARGSHFGRDVVRLSIVIAPGETATIDATIHFEEEPEGDFGDVELRTTPMVRDTPITLTEMPCT